MRKRIITTAAFMAAGIWAMSFGAMAQDTPEDDYITVQSLFEYPMAPDELEGIEAKSEWLVEHFWDKLDEKNKKAVDQTALNHAFNVFVTPMQWASREKTEAAVDKLIKRIEKNPTLLIQFAKAAEDNIYDPHRADMLIDEVYLKFAEALVKNKKIDKIRKVRYADQAKRLRATLPGKTAPEFSFKAPDGTEKRYFPMSTFTIIEFGDPTCDECRMAKLKMDVNLTLGDLIDRGKVNVLFIIPEETEGWEQLVDGYPAKWTVGASETVDEDYDIRLTPTFYTIGKDGKIISKNIPVETAIEQAINSSKQ